MTFIEKCLGATRPLLEWIDKIFTVPFSIKKMHGAHYYIIRDRVKAGTVFITDIYGAGTNLINPSEGKHAAIYFGFGLRTHIIDLLEVMKHSLENESINADYNRIKDYFDKCEKSIMPLRDDVAYVIEATGKGVIATNLVQFITSKDVVKAYNFTNGATPQQLKLASEMSIHDLGKPYDFNFSESEDERYCFEVAAVAYEEAIGVDLMMEEFKMPITGKVIHSAFLANTFTQDNDNWTCIINSKTEFPELYK